MPSAYEIITEKFTDQLEQGTVPWRKPWTCRELPMNLISKKPYSGVNVLLLMIAGYSSPYWLTLNQIKQKKGAIIEEQKNKYTIISFCKSVPKKDDPKKFYSMFRYYKVWNLEQCEDIDAPQSEALDFVENINAETIVNRYADCPNIEHRGDVAGYQPTQDYIVMPHRERFTSENHYYFTLFHEMAHSTGHKSRLDRLVIGCFNRQSKTYAFEELVAELTAAFLCHEAGIDQTDLFDNSAAYLASWIKRLKNDSRLIVSAAKHAQKAVEYMRGEYKPSGDKAAHEQVMEAVS